MRIQDFCALMPLALLVAAAPSNSPATHPADNEFASFGVVVTPPPATAGWKRIPEGGPGQIARWAHIGDDGKPSAILVLEMEPAKNRTAAAYAANLAKELNGHTSNDKVTMGGKSAIHVTGERQPKAPVETIVAANNAYIYVASCFADTPDQIPHDVLIEAARSLRFVPLADPSANLTMRGEKFPLFDRIAVEPLSSMRPSPEPPPDTISVSTFNFRAHQPDLIMNVQTVSNPNGATMETLQGLFPGKMNPEAKVKWNKVDAKVPLTVSTVFDAKNQEGSQKTQIALGLLPPDNQIVILIFSYANADPKALAAYEKSCEKMLQSIEPVKK